MPGVVYIKPSARRTSWKTSVSLYSVVGAPSAGMEVVTVLYVAGLNTAFVKSILFNGCSYVLLWW
jgi:hypothetical protein